jgi:transcriptional repressor NrdR
VRCPGCGTDDDKVVDSRAVDDGATTRRRRECLACGRRFTTYERIEEVPLVVLKGNGERQPFDRAKVAAGVTVAATGRPVDAEAIDALAAEVEEEVRLLGAEVPSEKIGIAVLERLRHLDQVAALRFASVYKGFDDLADFAREITELSKRT